MAKITLKQIREALSPDTSSLKDGVFTIRRGFFYTGGFTAEGYAAKVKAVFPDAIILGCGEVWKPFRGGAPVAQQSHWWVKFEVKPEFDYDSEGIRTDLRPRVGRDGGL